MNVLSKLSIKNLMLNKKRTISTIIGIILSVALICGVATLSTSMQETLIQNAINEYGYYHLKIADVQKSDIEVFENNRDVEKVRRIGRVGDAVINNDNSDSITFFRIFSMSEQNFNELKLSLAEGRFPANENEIVINKNIVTNAAIDLKIGDTVEFNLGEIDFTEEGEMVISSSEIKSYKIVGIINRPNRSFESYDAPYTVITSDFDTKENDAYIILKNPKEYKSSIPEILGGKDYEDINENRSQMKYPDFEINRELLRWEQFAFSDSTVTMLYSVVGIVLFVIIFTSVFCIRNSFAIATTEKIKMYGMLASVGATKKQIRHNVIFESMILGIIGIPLGILSGIFAIFVLLKIVNGLIGGYVLAYVEGIIFKVTLTPIIISVVLGVITIYLSAISSARKASKVSPIDNLRGSQEIHLKGKKLKTPKIISKTFKTGGVLAYKNLKRSKRKYRTTVMSIAVSIFIFITLNAFITNAFELSGGYYETYDYNFWVQGFDRDEAREDLVEEIVKLDNIDEYYITYNGNYLEVSDESKVNNEDGVGMIDEETYDEEKEEFVKTGKRYCGTTIVGLDDETFKKYTNKIGANYDKIKDKAILCDTYSYYDSNTEKMKNLRRYYVQENDSIQGEIHSRLEYVKAEFKIGKITDIKPYGFESYDMPGGFLVLNEKYTKDIELNINRVLIQSENTEQLEKDVKAVDYDLFVRNYEAEAREQNGMVMVVSIFLYGFISVITLIGITNIFNTITSNMELRQKEFAMLKSIGMTKKEFNNMINLETLFYGTKAWIYGTILGLIGTFALYKAFDVKMDQEMYIPVIPIIISAIFVFVFIFIIMRYSIANINKQNTIETIRKENI